MSPSMEHAPARSHRLFDELEQLALRYPVVVAHRGASGSHPENTVPAFAAAAALGVAMQEFDVQVTRDGALVCCHDLTLDRTTDASHRIGPGALLAQLTLAELQRLDAGGWKAPQFAGTPIPTLVAAVASIAPGIALIEHKAGTASAFVAAVLGLREHPRCVLQSFDWGFVSACFQAAPQLACAVLGPTTQHRALDAAAITAALATGAGMVHWHLEELRREQVLAARAAGLVVCTYTTDNDAGYLGGAQLGVQAMCSNQPEQLLRLQQP